MPLDGESTPWSGGWSDEPKRRMQLWRAFEEESVERFTDVRYELFRRNKSTVADEVIYRGRDRQRYLETWRDLLLEEDSSELDRLGSRVEVSRRSVAEFLLAVCEEISKLHQNGEIHGDIKPSNILAARVGPSVIDAVGLRAGDVCPLATAGWSPPEQLTRKPLSCSADVYTLALLFLRCLGGQRLGKLVTFRMPDGMDALHIDDPAVYFSQEKGILVGEGRQEWGHVLSKALCSRPAERYADAGAFLEATTAALAVEAPGGELTFELPWGDKPALSNFQTGHGEIVWVITG